MRPNQTDEVSLNIKTSIPDNEGPYWCECDIEVEAPISLAMDRELSYGRRRIGILMPGKAIDQRVNLYTKKVSVQGNYKIKLIMYLYGESGAISKRTEKTEEIKFSQ
jgi:hypothetical protein